jgi:hypothetical protein
VLKSNIPFAQGRLAAFWGHRCFARAKSEVGRARIDMSLTDLSKQVAALANRLRAMQADLADQPSDTRQEYMADEVHRSLADLTPTERAEFLAQLGELFPTWEQNVSASDTQTKATKVETQMDRQELQDPAFLAKRLCDMASQLSPSQRDAVTAMLSRAGLGDGGKSDWPAEPLAKLSGRLQFDESQPLSSANALELLRILSEFSLSVEQIAWNMFKAMAPNSTIKRSAPLQKLFAGYLTNDPDVPRGQVSQEVERLRKVNAALLSSVGHASREFAQHYAAKFSPAEIEAAVRTGPKKMFAGFEIQCWKKYTELAANAIDEAAIDHEIREIVRQFVESVI